MKVLMITGDKEFGPGHPRFELQASAVEALEVVYWGRENLWPKIPREKFDIVTAQDPFWRGLFGWCIARWLGARFNVQIHTPRSFSPLARFVISRADNVRVVSEKIKDKIRHACVYVLPVYVDVERFRGVERRPEHNTMLWIGRFEHEKDPLLALEVFKEVRGVVDARMIMLGSGSLEKSLQAAAKNLPVEFPGWQDPAPYLSRASVVLSTSRHESWGASIVEALAAGVPVVAPDVGVAAEAGAIVAPREQLAEAVVKTLQSNARGTLKLPLLSRGEWVRTWKDSLV